MLMTAEPRTPMLRVPNTNFVRRAVVLGSVVTLVCLGLCWSAFRTFRTLEQLQRDLLRNQASSISATVEFAGRDLEGISQSEFQHRIEEIAAEYDGLAELAVIDAGRRVLAHTDAGRLGLIFEAPGLEELLYSRKIYDERFETRAGEPVCRILLPIHVRASRDDQPNEAESPSSQVGPAFSVAAITLFVNSVSFVTRQGRWNLILTLSTCGLLSGVTFYYFLVLKRSLRMEAVEARERQWALLGRMSAALAHDIRNPLGAIKGLAQLLNEKPLLEDRPASYVETIVKEAARLEKLVGDLLIFAKPKEPQSRSFPLGEMLGDIAALFGQRFQIARVRMSIDDESNRLSLRTDYDLLKRVLINLVENSLLAMPEGGTLRISGRQGPILKTVALQLEDEGESLPAEGERLFEPFFTTRASGTGLGLAISRQIIERLGGTIQLENRPVHGASCTIVLPQDP
jgi:two-component system, NtrC family, sensor histidine kinase HydH